MALDQGKLTVRPAPADVKPEWLTLQQASTEIWASPTVKGLHSGAVLGFGLVSLEPGVQGESTILTNGKPIHSLPAWVGFAWGGIYNCPMFVPGSATPTPSLPSSGYVAVVIPTNGGAMAFSYSSKTSICDEPPTGPSITLGRYVLSIPWKSNGEVTDGSVLVRFTPPPCGIEESSSAGGKGSTYTVSLFWSIPINPLPCPAPLPRTERVALYPPGAPGTGGAVVLLHGKTGPARQIQLGP